MASIGASISRLGVRIRSAILEPGLEAADIINWMQAAITAPARARWSERPDFFGFRAPLAFRLDFAGSTTLCDSAREGSSTRAG
jgi:hypothetical protein